MYISPITSQSRVKTLSKTQNQPTFKTAQYNRVFSTEFSKGIKHVNAMFKSMENLRTAADSISSKMLHPFYMQFKADSPQMNLFCLQHGKGIYKNALEAAKPQFNFYNSGDGYPIISILNNGNRVKDSLFGRLFNSVDEDWYDAHVIFHGLNENRGNIMAFGNAKDLSYCITRGTYDNPQRIIEIFNKDNGIIKERLSYINNNLYRRESFNNFGNLIKTENINW